jgi:NADPH:quinone reductase-like Zn-dependent oxidoreductase
MRDSQGTMRAWAINAVGEQMRVMKLPVPLPGPGEVLVHIQGAEVGDWDELVRTGEWPMERPFPLVLGLAGAGTVAGVGPHVNLFALDDRVYAYSYPLYDNGAWAEYMLVPERYLAAAPAVLDLPEAGTLPIAGLTAHEALLGVLNLKQSETVLITAASGGVGHLAVQIAKSVGAEVVATAGRRNRDFVADLGADLVIDYTSEDVVKTIRARYPGGVDKVLNGAPGEAANNVVEAVREGGVIVDLPGEMTATRPGVRIVSDYAVRGDGQRLGEITRMVEDGRLRLEVQKLFPFGQAPDALATVLKKHVRGKIGLRIE